MDAVALSEGVRRGDFSNAEVTLCAIAQAEKLNPLINAINLPLFESAANEAARFDQSRDLLNQSPVAGLPLLIKDNAAVAGIPANFGSRLFEDYVPERSASIVRRYQDAGIIVLGKTNLPEFGVTITTEPILNGATLNPWDKLHSTGGSSGGAAAAVAAGIFPVAHGTDAGGSIRIPAACCGLFGLKPSRGLTVIEHQWSASWGGMSVGHVLSRSVRDSATYLDVIKLELPGLFPLPHPPQSFAADLNSDPGKLRIAVHTTHPMGQPIDQECLEAVDKAAVLCESLGHHLEECNHPVNYRPVVSAMAHRINSYVFHNIKDRLENLGLTLEQAPLERSSLIMAELGSKVSATEYQQALDSVKSAELELVHYHKDYDLILSPVVSKPPPTIGWLDMNNEDMKEYTERFRQFSGFTALYNGTGQPSMSVPLHSTLAGLPVGVMFTGAWGTDLKLLQLARQLEQTQPWPQLAPMATSAL